MTNILDEKENKKKGKPGFRSIGKITLINFLVSLFGNMIIRQQLGTYTLGKDLSYELLGFGLAQLVVNILLLSIAYSKRENNLMSSYILNIILLFLIGYSTCWYT